VSWASAALFCDSSWEVAAAWALRACCAAAVAASAASLAAAAAACFWFARSSALRAAESLLALSVLATSMVSSASSWLSPTASSSCARWSRSSGLFDPM
jgi:hypothetical protein